MKTFAEHEHLVHMLKESILLMCKSSLSYDVELNIEGLLGITLDKKDIFLVNINESIKCAAVQREVGVLYGQKRTSPNQNEPNPDLNGGRNGEPVCSAKKIRLQRKCQEAGIVLLYLFYYSNAEGTM